MPIVYHKELNGGWLALWQITESVEQLCKLVSDEYAQKSATYGSLSRRREWLAWHALVNELLGNVKVGYDSVGAPVLLDTEGFIGVSHEKEFIAVIYSVSQKCAVDIESLDRNFERVASRYISDSEMSVSEVGHQYFKAAVWCAKEVVYKSAGEQGLDLLADIAIDCTGLEKGLISGGVIGRDPMPLSLFLYENRLIVYTLLK